MDKPSNNVLFLCQFCELSVPAITIYQDIKSLKINYKCPCFKGSFTGLVKDVLRKHDSKKQKFNNPCLGNKAHSPLIPLYYCTVCKEGLCKQCYQKHKNWFQTHLILCNDPEILRNSTSTPGSKDTNTWYYCLDCRVYFPRVNTPEHQSHQVKDCEKYDNDVNEFIIQTKWDEARDIVNGYEKQLNLIHDKIQNTRDDKRKTLMCLYRVLKQTHTENKIKNEELTELITLLINNYKMTRGPINQVARRNWWLYSNFNDSIKFQSDEDDIRIEKEMSLFNAFLSTTLIINVNTPVHKYKCVSKITAHTSSIDCWLPLFNGLWASGSEDSTIKIWNSLDQSCVKTINAHKEGVYCWHQWKNGFLVSGSADLSIKIWDVQTFSMFSVIPNAHRNSIWGFMELENPWRWVSVSEDQVIKFWKADTLENLHSITRREGNWLAVQVWADGKLSVGDIYGTIQIWDTDEYELVDTIKGHSMGVNYIEQWKEGKFASASGDSTVKIWDNFTFDLLGVLVGHEGSVESLIQVNDGRWVSSSWDKSWKFWDVHNYTCTESFVVAHSDSVLCLTWINENTFASGSTDKVWKFWKAED